MTGRAFLTAILFGSAIAGTRLVAHAPLPQPHGRQGDTDGPASRGCPRGADKAATPRCAG